MIGAEASDSFKDSRAGDSAEKQKIEDAGVGGNSVAARTLFNRNGNLNGFSGGQHGSPY
jgi:hypothetical protein